ncbi:ATP-binding protein [uncultured Sphingomonas sp.]|uniref:ATP-binding protein n=1 Tax=uncultured Sphingomonas sp. TaxID=158754 RepID=UPI0025FA496F|nr:ATP-binding protein [uncultured Sphingomonas sp.]
MIHRIRPSAGLLGRILAILLLTVTIEFGVSTLLYERASRFSIREDEARRLAEHLVIARKLISERGWDERSEIADELTTDRYEVDWAPVFRRPIRLAVTLDDMRHQVIAWEPLLGRSALWIGLTSPGRQSTIIGAFRLSDGSWVNFRMREVGEDWDLALGRIVLALVPALALLVLGSLLIRRTLRPLRRLAHATERIGHGEEVLVEEAGTAEIRRLIRGFNEMQLRIHRLVEDRTQALAAVGHDMRTPLARLQLRLDNVDDEETRRPMEADLAEMNGLIGSLLAFLGGDSDPETPEAMDLAVVAETLVDDAADRGLEATYVGPEHLEARVRPIGLRRALSNLFENALKYGDRAVIRLDRGDGTIRFRIEDDGPGIPEDRLDMVLQPFIRLDSARRRNTEGLGLGLAIASRGVAKEGGTLRLFNRPEGGLCAEIILPAR